MTEDEARAWLDERNVPRGTLDRIGEFATFLLAENQHQNLIAASTGDQMWARHIVDSVQLLDLVGVGNWLDLGSGAGFPGLIVAAVSDRRVTLVESRAKRIAFLNEAAVILGIADRVEILGARAELLPQRTYAVISARAFAPLPKLLKIAHRFATDATTWVLPKGRSARSELAEIARSWQGDFRVVPSVTDSEAAIIVARNVRPGSKRR